jgi:hypothetical protein
MQKINNVFRSIFKNQQIPSLTKAVTIWIGYAACVGGTMSGLNKIKKICNEEEIIYKNEFLETPIQFVYQSSRVAAHTGWGAFIGGFTASTAPISIPAYMYWRSI